MGQFKGHGTATKKKQPPTVEVHNCLKQEVYQTCISLYLGSRDSKLVYPTHYVQEGSSFNFAY